MHILPPPSFTVFLDARFRCIDNIEKLSTAGEYYVFVPKPFIYVDLKRHFGHCTIFHQDLSILIGSSTFYSLSELVRLGLHDLYVC